MKFTRRFVIKVFIAVFLIIITALTLVALFSLLPRPMPAFNFLSGQKPLYNVKKNSYKTDFYSFKADVNNIHIKAKAELASLGYTERNIALYNSFYKFREWELPDHSILVTIKDNRRVKVFTDTQTSQYSSPDRYWDYPEDGWVTVEVRQHRRIFWLWFYP